MSNKSNNNLKKTDRLFMDETPRETPGKPLPFNNLFLVSGLVHGQNRGWMYIFSVALLVFGYVSFLLMIRFPLTYLLLQNGYSETTIATNLTLLFNSEALGIDRNFIFLIELGTFIFAFVGLYAGIRLVHGKPLLSVITGYEKFRFRRFFFAFGVWSLLVVLETLLEYILWPANFTMQVNYTGLVLSAIIAIALLPVQSGLEELFFRGYLMQGFSQVFRNAILPLLLTSFLFGFAHMDNPEVKKHGWPVMLSYYSLFGLFMGGLTLLDEGLELAFGIHMANNIAGCILVSPPDSVISSYSLLDSHSVNPPFELGMWVVMAVITFFLFWHKYRWKNYKLLLK